MADKICVIGFDINSARIEELVSGHDRTLEIEQDHLQAVSSNLQFSSDFSAQEQLLAKTVH